MAGGAFDAALTFSWLFNVRSLQLRPVVAGGAASFSVVQPNELADATEFTEFIQPDSVVLTVGIAFAGREGELGSYVEHLADAGAVAIGFGTGLTFAQVPEVVVAAARRRGIGLFEVPRQVPFIEIVTVAQNEQRRLAHSAQQRRLAAQEKLTATGTSGSLRRLLDHAAQLLAAGLTLADDQQRILLTAGDGQGPFATSYKMTTRGGGRFHTLTARSARRLSAEDRALLRHAAGLADMLLARPTRLRATRARLNSLAVALLLTGVEPPRELMADLLSPAGLILPVAVAAEQPRALAAALEGLDNPYAHAVDETATLLLFPGDRPVTEALTGLGGPRLRVAVGSPVAATSLTSALVSTLVARARAATPGQPALPTRLPLLADASLIPALATRRHELVDPLRAHDASHGTRLEETLRAFVANDAHLARTAEALGAHRHTVRHRVERIGALTGLDLADAAARAEALLALLSEDFEGEH